MILTTRHKNCARCAVAAQFARETAQETGQTDVKHHIERGNERHWGRAVVAPAKPFTFQYDAVSGVLIAAALREKAKTHRDAAKGYRTNAGLGTQLQDFYLEQAQIADNNAQLLEEAADEIHGPVHEELTRNVDAAFTRMGM